MNDLHKSRVFAWTLFLLFCLIWFYMLAARTLVPTDEGRYAEMAREMLATGDWITTRLNGIKYFEKPPLQIWMTALAFKIFGLGEWQARLWTGLTGLLGIVLVAYTGYRVFDKRVGVAAGLVLASSFWWAGLGHVNTLDMGLSGMMTLALCTLLIAQRNNASVHERRNWMLLCWIGMALSVLSKGLIGIVLPSAVLAFYTLIARDRVIWKRLHIGPGLLIFLAITAPWFILVSIKNPEFPHFFFIYEHFERFALKLHHREGPWYYFFPILLGGILPWLGVLLPSLWRTWRSEAVGFQPQKMLLAWTVFIFFFFSISNSKLPSYILPIFPALALLIARYLQNASYKAWRGMAGLITILAVAGLAFVSKIPGMTAEPLELSNYQASQSWIVAACSVVLAGGLAVLWMTRKKRTDLSMLFTLVFAITGFIGGQLLMLSTESQGHYRSGLPLVPAIEAEAAPGIKLYAVGLYDQTLPFYLRRTMTLVEQPDELAFGLAQEPHLWLPTREAFIEQWTQATKAIAITRHEIFVDLQKRGVPMRVIAKDSRRVVITNDLKNKI